MWVQFDMIRQIKVDMWGPYDWNGCYNVTRLSLAACILHTWHTWGPCIIGWNWNSILSLLRHSYHFLLYPKYPLRNWIISCLFIFKLFLNYNCLPLMYPKALINCFHWIFFFFFWEKLSLELILLIPMNWFLFLFFYFFL